MSDIETAGEASGLDNIPPLYRTIPGYADTETEGEGYSEEQSGTSKMTSHQQHEQPMRELSGRSRSILKQYFEIEDAYTFPVGHRIVAFTEPQIYHLLRVLTDEAINMTCTTMKRMVIGAVRGTPATAPSKTEQFRIRTRAQTPGPIQTASSGSEGGVTDTGHDSETCGDFSTLLEVRDISMPKDSDSSVEMALIASTFRRSAFENTEPIQRPHSQPGSHPGEELLRSSISRPQ